LRTKGNYTGEEASTISPWENKSIIIISKILKLYENFSEEEK